MKPLLRTSFIIIRTTHLSSRNLSSFQLKSSLYKITVSYAAVRLTNSAGILLSLEKIVNDLYNLIPGLICSDISDHFSTFVTASNTTKANNNKPIFRINMEKFNFENFKKDVFKTLSPFYNCLKLITTDNFNSLFANFISNFKQSLINMLL